MKGFSFLLIFLLSLINFSAAAAAGGSPTDFIRMSCKATTYPDLCVQCLTAYRPALRRSPHQLAHAAITVSATRTSDASTYLSAQSTLMPPGGAKSLQKGDGTGSLGDCAVAMAHSADRLRKSVEELRLLGRPGSRGFARRMSNVQTWISAALTDQNACLNSLAADSSGTDARKKVVEVSRVTSNALALVNRLGPAN